MHRTTSRPRLLLAPAATALAVAAGAWALRVRDPHVEGAWGWCPLLALTGLPCPGCGGLRAGHQLLEGDVASALGSNALVVLAAPAVLVLWTRWTVQRASGRDVAVEAPSGRLAVVLVVVLMAFTLVRLLPIGAALGP